MTKYAIKRMLDGKSRQPSDPVIATFNAEIAAQNRLENFLEPDQRKCYYIAPVDV